MPGAGRAVNEAADAEAHNSSSAATRVTRETMEQSEEAVEDLAGNLTSPPGQVHAPSTVGCGGSAASPRAKSRVFADLADGSDCLARFPCYIGCSSRLPAPVRRSEPQERRYGRE